MTSHKWLEAQKYEAEKKMPPAARWATWKAGSRMLPPLVPRCAHIRWRAAPVS